MTKFNEHLYKRDDGPDSNGNTYALLLTEEEITFLNACVNIQWVQEAIKRRLDESGGESSGYLKLTSDGVYELQQSIFNKLYSTKTHTWAVNHE